MERAAVACTVELYERDDMEAYTAVFEGMNAPYTIDFDGLGLWTVRVTFTGDPVRIEKSETLLEML